MRKFLVIAMAWAIVALPPAGFGQSAEAGYQTTDLLLKKYTKAGRVDYTRWHANEADVLGLISVTNDFANLATSTFQSWTKAQQKAFWINAYNLNVIRTILDRYPLPDTASFFASAWRYVWYPTNSVQQIPGYWTETRHVIIGRAYSLIEIEQYLHGKYKDPRLYMALVNGSKGGGLLLERAYRAETLDADLTNQARYYLRVEENLACDATEGTVVFSETFENSGPTIVSYYQEKYGQRASLKTALLDFISPYAPPGLASCLARPDLQVEFSDYDWSLNAP